VFVESQNVFANAPAATPPTFGLIVLPSAVLAHSHTGWLHGTYDGRTGAFPASYVSAILGEPTPAAIDNARLQVRSALGLIWFFVLCL
jgi:hypothetical protein